MERHPDYEQLCELYLLGELSEAEQANMEEAYFADDSLFERFLAVKDDLLDAYSRGDLTGQKLDRFERHYLTSKARRQGLEETRDLIQVASAASIDTANDQTVSSELFKSGRPTWLHLFKSRHPVAWRIGFVTAAVLLIAGSWIIVREARDRAARRSAEERARNERPTPAQNGTNVNRPPGPAPTYDLNPGGEQAAASPSPSAPFKPKPPSPNSAAFATVTLLPFTSRDAGSASTLALSPEQRVVRLKLVFGDGGYDSFEVSVRTVDGQQVTRREGLKASSNETGKTVTLTFDSSLLRRQDYIVSLRGSTKNGKPQTIAEYYFRVQRTTPPSPTASPDE